MKKQYIIPLFVTLLAACSSNEPLPTADDAAPEETTAVGFSASIQGSSSSRAEDGEDYLHNSFIFTDERKSRIRVVNTVNYSVPDFKTEGAYKEYTYTGQTDKNGINFTPTKDGSGFDWNEIRPTAAAFVFEAACYPMTYTHFSEIETDQTTRDNFWKADLLLAHHAQPLSDRYDLVKLKFHHVFAMVRVTIDLPISPPQQDGGFPENAIECVQLIGMQTGYETEYSEAIPNDGARTVYATGEKRDITMYPLLNEIKEGDGTTGTQRSIYCGIIPAQSISPDQEWVKFRIKTYTGEFNNNNLPVIKSKNYIFRPEASIPLTQGYITNLELTSNVDETEIIQLKASVEEWDPWYTTMPMEPDGSNTTDTPTSPDTSNEPTE